MTNRNAHPNRSAIASARRHSDLGMQPATGPSLPVVLHQRKVPWGPDSYSDNRKSREPQPLVRSAHPDSRIWATQVSLTQPLDESATACDWSQARNRQSTSRHKKITSPYKYNIYSTSASASHRQCSFLKPILFAIHPDLRQRAYYSFRRD